jgi:hypothetical protein
MEETLIGVEEAARPHRGVIDQWRESCAGDFEREVFDEYINEFIRLKSAGKINFGVPVLLRAIEEDERLGFIKIAANTLGQYITTIKREGHSANGKAV